MNIPRGIQSGDKETRLQQRSKNLEQLSKSEKEELLKMAVRAISSLCDEWIPYLYSFHQANIDTIAMSFDDDGELRMTLDGVSLLYNIGTNTAKFDLMLPKRYTVDEEVYKITRHISSLLSPNIRVK